MVVLRATRNVLGRVGGGSPCSEPSDTALGDWVVTRLVVDRQPLLLMISAKSYLAMIVPAKDVAALPGRLAGLLAVRLKRMGIPSSQVAAEERSMHPVIVAPTSDRSVNGILVQFAKEVPVHLPIDGWDATSLPFLEAQLAKVPCHASRRFEDVIVPDGRTPDLLAKKWG